MGKYILKRLGYLILTLWVIITITFFLMNTLPGNPLMVKVRTLPPQVQQNLLKKWGLTDPVPVRYVKYLKNLLKGDLGESVMTPGLTVSRIIKERFPASARLGLQAVFLALTLGFVLGILAALNRNTWIDYFVMSIAILGVSVPSFVIAALMQYFFAGELQWFPIIGWPAENPMLGGMKYTVLPTVALCFASLAEFARYMRASVLDVINQDYILTAKAKGASKSTIIRKHIIRNAIIPVITVLGPAIASTITGSFIIERIFTIPGIGEYYITSISNRDYTMIMAMTIFFSFLYAISLLIVDVLYGIIDPRIRVSGGKR